MRNQFEWIPTNLHITVLEALWRGFFFFLLSRVFNDFNIKTINCFRSVSYLSVFNVIRCQWKGNYAQNNVVIMVRRSLIGSIIINYAMIYDGWVGGGLRFIFPNWFLRSSVSSLQFGNLILRISGWTESSKFKVLFLVDLILEFKLGKFIRTLNSKIINLPK